MFNRLRRLLPHAAILICNMYVVFYLIDRVNTAMNFIDNGLTKGLLLALCVIAFVNCRMLLRFDAQAQRAPHRFPEEGGRYGYGARGSERRPKPYQGRQTRGYGDAYGARRRPNDADRRYADDYGPRRTDDYDRRLAYDYDQSRYDDSNRGRARDYDRQRSGDRDRRRADDCDRYAYRRPTARDYEGQRR